MQSNYRDDLERLLTQYALYLFEQIVETENLYQSCTRWEVNLILRYHSQAVLGILREWTPEDTKNLDRIVHQVYLLMAGQIQPHN